MMKYSGSKKFGKSAKKSIGKRKFGEFVLHLKYTILMKKVTCVKGHIQAACANLQYTCW